MRRINEDMVDSNINIDSSLRDFRDEELRRRLDIMSPRDFCSYLAGPLSLEERTEAYRYLFEGVCDNPGRAEAIVEYAEMFGVLTE